MTDAATTELAIVDETTAPQTDVEALIASMSNPGSLVYSSFAGDSFADRVRVLSALTDTTPLNEHLGELIQLRNFVVQPITISTPDPKTGEVEVSDTARVIIVDEDGTAYHCTSLGVATALSNFISIMKSEPSGWEHAIPVVPTEERTRRGFRVLTLKVDYLSLAENVEAAAAKGK